MVDVFIGLEIHIQLMTQSKVFCSCAMSSGEEPNTNICPICMGYPGVLPSVNEHALFLSYLMGAALNCTPARKTWFDRKNYFYPDMTKNYQISQFSSPVGTGGCMDYLYQGELRSIRIHDIHLEEDAGKMLHQGNVSMLDYNRAGSSLLEIVTEPELDDPGAAEVFLQSFRSLVRYLGTCDGNMETGSLRCDANVSVNNPGMGLGTKVEIKNLNSSRFVRKALEYEVRRQSRLVHAGKPVQGETRLWNEQISRTEPMRVKEAAKDYRYFSEPDIPQFIPTQEFLNRVSASLTELPAARELRYLTEFGLNAETARYLAEERERADFFESLLLQGTEPETAGAWMKGEAAKLQGRYGFTLPDGPLTPPGLAALLRMVARADLTANQAKQVLELMVRKNNADPEEIIRQEGIRKAAGEDDLKHIVQQIIAEHQDIAAQIRDGNMKALGYLMGMVMKVTRKSADPQTARKLLLDEIGLETEE